MVYQKITKILDETTPKDKAPILTQAQIEGLKDAASIALAVIASVGAMGIAVVAPNLLSALNHVFSKKQKYKNISQNDKKKKTAQVFYYLKKRGLIEFKEEKGVLKILLSKSGRQKSASLNVASLRIQKASHWDGKWWQVAADIPTKHYRQGADMLRRKLKQMGFCPLQRTLWFFPFDPRKEIEFVSKEYGISQFVTVMEISRMDVQDEEKLLKYFQL